MEQGSMALGTSVLGEFLTSIDNTFNILQELTGVDFLGQSLTVEDDFEGKYFGDWLSDYGNEIINQLKSVQLDSWQSDDLLDCLDYNVFALSKAVDTKDADIIYATVADCLADVKKAVDEIVKKAVDDFDSYGSYEVIAFSDEDASASEKAFPYAIAC